MGLPDFARPCPPNPGLPGDGGEGRSNPIQITPYYPAKPFCQYNFRHFWQNFFQVDISGTDFLVKDYLLNDYVNK
jgi:hypothetical protein